MIVQVDGKPYNFPDDATDEEINEFFESEKPKKSKGVTREIKPSLEQRILEEKKATFKSLPASERRLAGFGSNLASLPGIKQIADIMAGRDINQDQQEYQTASQGDLNSGIGEFVGDVSMTANPAKWAGMAGKYAKLSRPVRAMLRGGQAGLASTAIHQAENIQTGRGFQPLEASLETGVSAGLPGISAMTGVFLKKVAPGIMRSHVKPLLATMDSNNPPNFANVFEDNVKVPYFGGVEGLKKGVDEHLGELYARRSINAKYASLRPKGSDLSGDVQFTGQPKPSPEDFRGEVFLKEPVPTPDEIRIADQLRKPTDQPWKKPRGSAEIIRGNVDTHERFRALKHYQKQAKNEGRKDFHNMEQEVLSMIRGSGYKIPPSGFGGIPIAEQMYMKQNREAILEGFETGFGSDEMERLVAKNLPEEFTTGGVYFKRINTKDPSIVKVQNKDGHIFEFKPGAGVYTDPIQTLPAEKIMQENDYLAYIDEINQAKPVPKQESASVVDNVKRKLNDLFDDPTKKWIPKTKEEASDAVDFWKEQGLGRATFQKGKMTVEDALAFRTAIDKEINFRAKSIGGIGQGFNEVSQMFRRELNDFIKAKSPIVGQLTEQASRIEPLQEAIARRALQEANNYKMGLLDIGAGGVAGSLGGYFGNEEDRKRNALLGLGLGVGARRLTSTVGGASMLNDAGSGLLRMPNSPFAGGMGQLLRSGANEYQR